MTNLQIKERITKAQEKITKKENTIVKKTAQIEKKKSQLSKMGFDPDADRMDLRSNNDAYWIGCDIVHLNEDIERGRKEIEETKKTIAKYEAQLAGEIAKESIWSTEIPEIMLQLVKDLNQNWDEYDTERRERLSQEYKELSYREFIKKYNYFAYELLHKDDEEIHKENEKDAKAMVLDLYNRVKEITGEVTDWNGIHAQAGNTFPVLNGIVRGKEGAAEIESILAGGYNIQKLHVRVLVKAL